MTIVLRAWSIRASLFAFICLSAATAAHAATTEPASPTLAKGDRVLITIVDLIGPGERASYEPLIEDDGKIGLPLVRAIDATGQTTDELKRRIIAAYRSENLISDAEVTVNRIETHDAPKTGRGLLKIGGHVLIHICDIEAPGKRSEFARQIDGKGEVEIACEVKTMHIPIARLIERDAASRIGKELIDDNLLGNPQVDVERAADK